MAITAIEYSLIRSLRRYDRLPLGGDVLEIGEANWYGDVGLQDLRQDIGLYAAEDRRDALIQALDDLVRREPPALFEIAKLFWQTFLRPKSLTAIDLHGGADALKLDLNEPVDLGRRFDLVINFGTIEHVFNVARALQTVHDHTRPGGLMLHGMPLSGWVDHGFYSFNSTFYFDLARANGYGVESVLYTELDPLKIVQLADREAILRLSKTGGIGPNSLLYAVLRRPQQAAPFRTPMQGYYEGALTGEAALAWKHDR